MTDEITFKCSPFLRNWVRHELKRGENHGVSWLETKGIFSSYFTVSAKKEVINQIEDWLDESQVNYEHGKGE